MKRSTVEQFLNETRPARERLASKPGDVAALAALRRALDFLDVSQAANDVRQLVAAAKNLLDRLIEGAIEANEQSATLLGQASFALREGGPDRRDIVDQLDALASGLDSLDEPPPAPAPSEPVQEQRLEPPLLTIRDDGTRVEPGSFEPEEEQRTQAAAAAEASGDDQGDQKARRSRSSRKRGTRASRRRGGRSSRGKDSTSKMSAPEQTPEEPPSAGIRGARAAPTIQVGARGARLSPKQSEPTPETRPVPQQADNSTAAESRASQPSDADKPAAALLADLDVAVNRLSEQINALGPLTDPSLTRAVGELSMTSQAIARLKNDLETRLTEKSTD